MKNFKDLFLGVILIGIAGACSPSSQITGSWKNTKIETYYDKIMVAGLTPNVEAKSTIENDLTAALTAKGVVVIKSIDAFPQTFTKDVSKDEMLSKIRNQGADAILTVTLVDKQTESRYVPGTYGYAPMPMYNRFWGYYNYWGPTMYSPTYYTQDKIYYIETNVYDAKTEELVWSAESETYNPENLSGFSPELANIIAKKLEKDGIISVRNKIPQPDKQTVSKINK
jgi:hypothetical protein